MDMELEALRLLDLQPSQFYVSQKKLDAVKAWFDPADLSNFEPLPVKKLRGKYVLTDGHTRAWAAYCAGLERVPLMWDTDDWLDWDAYEIDVEECAARGVYSAADFVGRVVPAQEYIEKWNHWCDVMHDILKAYRARHGVSVLNEADFAAVRAQLSCYQNTSNIEEETHMILIKGGLVRPVTGPDIENGEILVDGGKIVAIGAKVDAPADAQVIDATGLLVAPGFIDGHCHIGMSEECSRWEGNDTNEYSDPITPQMRAIDAINPMDEAFANAIKGGVTTAVTGPGSANVIGGTFCAMKLHGTCVDDMVIKQPIAMKIAFGENPKGVYGQNGRKAPTTRMAVAALLRETLFKAKRYMEEVDAAEKDPTQKRPFDMKLEALLPVMRGEIPLKSHAHRPDDILTSVRVAKEFGLKITLDHCTSGALIVDKLVEFGYPVLVGPSFGSKTKQELKDKSFATAGILERAGLDVSIITDAPVIPLNYLPLCAGLAVKEGMSMEGAWKAITINPAKVAGIEDRVGSLEAGKDADIVLYNGDPLRDIACETKMVLVDGKIVYQA